MELPQKPGIILFPHPIIGDGIEVVKSPLVQLHHQLGREITFRGGFEGAAFLYHPQKVQEVAELVGLQQSFPGNPSLKRHANCGGKDQLCSFPRVFLHFAST